MQETITSKQINKSSKLTSMKRESTSSFITETDSSALSEDSDDHILVSRETSSGDFIPEKLASWMHIVLDKKKIGDDKKLLPAPLLNSKS